MSEIEIELQKSIMLKLKMFYSDENIYKYIMSIIKSDTAKEYYGVVEDGDKAKDFNERIDALHDRLQREKSLSEMFQKALIEIQNKLDVKEEITHFEDEIYDITVKALK